MTSRAKLGIACLLVVLIGTYAIAQVQTIPNTTFPAVRSLMNSNFSYLDANKITFHSGSGVPSINCTQGLDAYTRTSNGAMYWCTATNTWTLLGATGPTGPTGPTGASGATGPTGPTGPSGTAATLTQSVANAAVTGTTAKHLAEINSSGNAVLAGTDIRKMAFIVAPAGGSCSVGTTGSACLVIAGAGTCTADASGIAAGNIVVKSGVTSGRCADSGFTFWPSVIDPNQMSAYPLGIAVTSCAANADCTVMR